MDREAGLREALVSRLERAGTLALAPVAAAMRAVPRHAFVPECPLDDAYADRALPIKTRDGEVLSSISQPGMIAQMLGLLAPRPGERVLEIGTGSGYNAALLAELVGTSGTVTTVEVECELAQRAQARLHDLGYANVRALAADGAAQAFGSERFDRIIVTARVDDIAEPWWTALEDGARLVAPLRLEGAGEYAVGFVRSGAALRSIGAHPCAFIALRGEAAGAGDAHVFYRDPARRQHTARIRRVSSIVAVRRDDAQPELLERADVVVARPVTVFAVTFDSAFPPT